MPAMSKRQFRAMQAAAHGKSTLGISKQVGKDFVSATPSPKTLPERQGQMSNDAFHSGPVRQKAKHGANPQVTNQTPHQAQARHRIRKASPLHARVKAGLQKAFPVSNQANAAPTPITQPDVDPTLNGGM